MDTCVLSWSTLSRRKMISLSLLSTSIAASRFKFRFRTLPENLAARIAALTISSTATLMISIFLVMASAFGVQYGNNVSLQRKNYSIVRRKIPVGARSRKCSCSNEINVSSRWSHCRLTSTDGLRLKVMTISIKSVK